MVKIIETPGGHRATCVSLWNGSKTELVLGQADIDGDYVVAILLDEDGDIMEWLHASTYWETVQNFTTEAHTIMLLDGDDSEAARVVRQEAALYNDCFGYAVA